MRVRSLVVGATLVVAPVLASADRRDDFVFARQAIEPPAASLRAVPRVAQSRTIYLNKDGVTLLPGDNDARTNHSTLAQQPTAIAAWTPAPEVWADTVACMSELFARWDVTITDVDPGDVPHVEAVFGGTPAQLGLAGNTAGVAPFTTNCSIIENAMVITFTEILPENARMVCEIMAQEVAHAYGLDHEMLPPDPMTYLDYDGDRAFQDEDASCGEHAARPCGIGGTVCRATQNSVALLTERLGLAGGTAGSGGGAGGSVVPPGATTTSPLDEGGCAAGGGAGLAVGLVGVFLAGLQRRRAHR